MSTEIVNGARPRAAVEDPDAAIVQRIRAGETGLYEVLIRRYNQRMYRVARAVLREDAGVEDVMQEAYLRAFTALPQFQGRARFSTWLTRILVNCALAYRRKRLRRPEVALESVAEAAAPSTAGDGSEEVRLLSRQVGRLIERTLERLPESYRVIFVMREVEEMSVAETAACLGISAVNTKVRLHRAKKLLQTELRRQVPDISVYTFLGVRCETLTRRVMRQVQESASRPAPPPSPSGPPRGRTPAGPRPALPPGG